MPGRTFSATSYRFGFSGKEKDNEVKGSGNQIDFGARVYDPRLGRWLSLDQITNPSQSPYCAFNDNPTYIIDPDGKWSRLCSGKYYRS